MTTMKELRDASMEYAMVGWKDPREPLQHPIFTYGHLKDVLEKYRRMLELQRKAEEERKEKP